MYGYFNKIIIYNFTINLPLISERTLLQKNGKKTQVEGSNLYTYKHFLNNRSRINIERIKYIEYRFILRF